YQANRVGEVAKIELPPVVFEVWSCSSAASTSDFLRRVAALRKANPGLYEQRLALLGCAAEEARDACVERNAQRWLSALDAQAGGLDALGQSAGIPIFTSPVRTLRGLAAKENAVVVPAGAGGGDIALFVGQAPPSASLSQHRQRLGLETLRLQLGARGVHLLSESG